MFRFMIRDVLWLTVVVAMGVGWWNERRIAAALKREREEATMRWHDASKKWVDATSLPSEAWGRRGGLGGRAVSPMPGDGDR